MVSKKDKNAQRLKRHARVRGKISGTPERHRLAVYRSNANIYAQIIDEVKPDPADIVVYKNRFNGFVNTTLEKQLRQMQINTVIMTGWRSDVCVTQTAIEAFYRGFRVAVADDGVDSTTEAEHRQGMQLLAINYNFDFYPCETILENLLQQE